MGKRIHGMSGHKLYITYNGMIQRCTNPKNSLYKWYGGRGIGVCDEWLNDINKFISYTEALPYCLEEGRSIDRINNDGNYEPGNLRWATKKEQANNTSRNVYGPKRKPKQRTTKGTTPITPLRMPLELKEKAILKAKEKGVTLSKWIFNLIEDNV